jgi:hypothetical protein
MSLKVPIKLFRVVSPWNFVQTNVIIEVREARRVEGAFATAS